MPNFSYSVLGTGAIGGYYGGRLQQSGAEVHFLLRSDYNHVRQHGLTIESADGDFVLSRVNAYQNVADMPPSDVVLLALKTTHNHQLSQLLPQLLKDDGLVLVLQNGLGVEDEVADLVGAERVLGGLCFICANKVGPGHIRHLDYGRITLGEFRADYQPGGITPRLQALAEDLESAQIPVAATADLIEARWKKLVWNIPYNGLSVVLNARTDALMQNADSRRLVETLMQEVLTGAKAVHQRAIPSQFVADMMQTTDQMTPYNTSMKVDYDAGRPMEVEAIFGSPLQQAQAAGLALPQLAMLTQQLRFLNERAQS